MPGAVGVGVLPDMAAEALVAVGLALGERRVGEQRGRDRLERQADTELLHHVGFGRIIEIHLDGTGAQHHVEAEAADLRHVIEHDRVAALGHDRQLGAGLVGPHAECRGSRGPSRSPTALHWSRWRAASAQVWWRFSSAAPRQLELAGGLEADVPVRAGQRDDVAVLDDRLPAEFGQAHRAGRGCRRARHSSARDGRSADRRTSHARCRCASARAASRRRQNTDSRSSRLSMSGLALSSVRVRHGCGAYRAP